MMIRRKSVKGLSFLIILNLLLISPLYVKAESGNTVATCIETKTYDYVTDNEGLLKLAIKQADDSKNMGKSYAQAINNDNTLYSNNGILATQLIREDVFSDGSVERDYVANNMAVQDKITGDTYTYVSTNLPRSLTQYNVIANQTIYFTFRYTENGSPVYTEARVHCTREESYVNSFTQVARITHGIRATLLNFTPEDDRTVNGAPVNNQIYTTYATNSTYYRDDTTGDYFTFLNVLTADNKSFELDFSLLSTLDS